MARDPRTDHPDFEPTIPPRAKVPGVPTLNLPPTKREPATPVPAPIPIESDDQRPLTTREVAGMAVTAGKQWTPLGIGIAIAAPIVLVLGTLALILGKDGLVEIASAWRASATADGAMAAEVKALGAEVKALRAEVKTDLSGMKADLAAYSGRTEKIQIAAVATDQRVNAICDLATALNKGRPHDTWCGEQGRGILFFAPSLGALTPYYLTAAHWPKSAQ